MKQIDIKRPCACCAAMTAEILGKGNVGFNKADELTLRSDGEEVNEYRAFYV